MSLSQGAAADAAAAAHRRRGLLGIVLAMFASASFTGATVSTIWSYEGGAEPMAAITIRFAGAVVVLVTVMRLLGIPFMLPPRQRLFALGLGCVLAVQSYCLYHSFALIPVGLTFAIFYIYPMLVTLMSIATRQDRMTPLIGVALAVAFSGLVLVFNVTGSGMNLEGAALAIGASLSWSLIAVASARLMRDADPRQVTLHMQVASGAIYLALCALAGGFVLPETAKGWTGYLALPVFYAFSTVAFFAAISMIGSIRASLIMNLEPVFTIAAGFIILGQTLTIPQLLGATLVIAAVFAVRLRKPEPAAADP